MEFLELTFSRYDTCNLFCDTSCARSFIAHKALYWWNIAPVRGIALFAARWDVHSGLGLLTHFDDREDVVMYAEGYTKFVLTN